MSASVSDCNALFQLPINLGYPDSPTDNEGAQITGLDKGGSTVLSNSVCWVVSMT